MRTKVILVCEECLSRNYTTTKNPQKNTERIEMKKFLVAIFATLLLFGGLSANAFGKKSADTLALVPTMNTETSAGKCSRQRKWYTYWITAGKSYWISWSYGC